MNLITETQRRLQYQKDKISDLSECLNKNLTKYARHYIQDEIVKANKNIQYYSEILEKLEDK
jgi:ABC-type Fe3+-citrate transport system substrate-binding protein